MRRNKLHLALFILYTLFVLWLLLARPRELLTAPYWHHTARHFNPFPLRTIRLYLDLLFRRGRPDFVLQALANLAGNILLFIPLGYYLPALFAPLRGFWRTLLWGAAAVCIVEAAQMLLLVGTCDIDDLLLNSLGIALGYLVYSLSAP